MAHNCKNCKFHDVDYGLDDKADDEVERFTECDKCEYLLKCKSNGCVINATNSMDSREHFIRGLNAYCRKETKPFEGKKLSEIIEMVYKPNDPELKNGKELLHKAIKQFGDITYEEFIKDKLYKMYHV